MERYALLFLSSRPEEDIENLPAILNEFGLTPLLPQNMPWPTDRIALVVLGHTVENSQAICTQLRQQEDFAQKPMLVLVPFAHQVRLFEHLAAVALKPMAALAFRNYLTQVLRRPASARPALPERAAPPVVPVSAPPERPAPPVRPAYAPPVAPRPAAPAPVSPPMPNFFKAWENAPPLVSSAGNGTPDSAAAFAQAPTTPLVDTPEASEILDLPPMPSPLSTTAAGFTAMPNALHDVLPAMTQPLPAGSNLPAEDYAAPICDKCHRWKLRADDAFCARCGVPLTDWEMPAELLFEPLGNHRFGRLLEIRNTGQSHLPLSFEVTAGALAQRFTLDTHATALGRNAGGQLRVVFDAQGFDLSVRQQTTLAVSTTNGTHEQRHVRLVIEPLPQARVTPPVRCDFVIEGVTTCPLTIHNDGGGTLTLTRVTCLGEPAADLTWSIAGQLATVAQVQGGQQVTIALNLPAWPLAPGPHHRTLRCEFAQHEPVNLDLVIEAIRPPLLKVDKLALDLGVVAIHRRKKGYITLRNTGGEPLHLRAVASSASWLHCLTPLPLILDSGRTVILDLAAQCLPADAARLTPGTPARWTAQLTLYSDAYETPAQPIAVQADFVAPQTHKKFIGIDFGTTASCIAVMDRADVPSAVPLETSGSGDNRIMPSVIYFQEEGAALMGHAALHAARTQPQNAVASIKRALGRKALHHLAGRDYSAVELTTEIIRHLVECAEDGLFEQAIYETPARAVITAPVEFTDAQQRNLIAACEAAQLQVGAVIDEASAAALYYVQAKGEVLLERAERLLIFDFGGGTLDCALIEISADDVTGKMIFDTRATGGDPKLGGEDLDWALVGLLAYKAAGAYPDFDVNCLGDLKHFPRLYPDTASEIAARECRAAFKYAAEAAKISLSNQLAASAGNAAELSAPVQVSSLLRKNGGGVAGFFLTDGNGHKATLETTLTVAELEHALSPFLARAVSTVETLCAHAGVPMDEVDTILHVGRTSLLSLIRQRINERMPQAKDRSTLHAKDQAAPPAEDGAPLIEPKICVSLGAAHWGACKDDPTPTIEFRGNINRLRHAVGYVSRGLVGGRFTDRFYPIIPAQTEFPCVWSIELELEAGRESITLRLAKNRGLKLDAKNNPEIYRLNDITLDARDVADGVLKVFFKLDENRLLSVIANGQTYIPTEQDEE